MKDRVYTVTEFNRMVKGYIESNENFQEFFLKGELSSVTYYKSGHLYFTIKDKNSQIKCAAFNYKYKRISSNLKEGDSVKIFGDVGFYENRGDFQVLVRHIEKEDKLGEMYAQLEKIKIKLEKEGLFSNLYKQNLPKYPQSIGVVTAYTGAAFHDIINTTRKRFNNIDIYIYSSKVQGVGATEEIIKGIETLNKIPEIDLIIAGRGGGSVEDLWAFNEESVARAFFNSEKPIISAVGHEIDNLLTDLVGDVRAATPTQAIEIAIPVKKDIVKNLKEKENYLKKELNRFLLLKEEQIESFKKNYILKNFKNIIEDKNYDLVLKEEEINSAMKALINKQEHILDLKIEKVVSLNPIKILKRGYSISKINGKIVKETCEIKIGDIMETVLLNGKTISEIKEIKK